MANDRQVDGQAESHLDVEESGIFTWSLETNIVQGDTSLARLFGVVSSAALTGLPIEAFLDRIHPDDRPRVAQSIHHSRRWMAFSMCRRRKEPPKRQSRAQIKPG